MDSDDDLINTVHDAVPELTQDNYHEWARKIRELLRLLNLDGFLRDKADVRSNQNDEQKILARLRITEKLSQTIYEVCYRHEIHGEDPRRLWDDLEKHIVPKGCFTSFNSISSSNNFAWKIAKILATSSTNSI